MKFVDDDDDDDML